jgi:hypothetical protein
LPEALDATNEPRARQQTAEHDQPRVERSLYERANGYNFEAVKIFMPPNREKPVYAPYVEHVPPDVTACIFWLKNRDPQHWRDSQRLEHVLGRYIIGDQPMTEEQWARERATVIAEAAVGNPARRTTRLPATSCLNRPSDEDWSVGPG